MNEFLPTRESTVRGVPVGPISERTVSIGRLNLRPHVNGRLGGATLEFGHFPMTAERSNRIAQVLLALREVTSKRRALKGRPTHRCFNPKHDALAWLTI